jgi:hypothetical protein
VKKSDLSPETRKAYYRDQESTLKNHQTWIYLKEYKSATAAAPPVNATFKNVELRSTNGQTIFGFRDQPYGVTAQDQVIWAGPGRVEEWRWKLTYMLSRQ